MNFDPMNVFSVNVSHFKVHESYFKSCLEDSPE